MSSTARPAPPDQSERVSALHPTHSILVQAPAGSGKTDLLSRRFLRLLAEVDEPGQVVAITFTTAAAAEMRHRILAELEKAAANPTRSQDEFSMDALALHALEHSRALGWKLLDLPAQLRISTVDSFCRDLALQQPLLSGLGGGLDIGEQPAELYRRAARRTLEKIDQADSSLGQAIEALLMWRDNGWQEMEDLLVVMLSQRDRWMHDFVLGREPDMEALRQRLERPFANAVREALCRLGQLLDQVPHARQEALELARFACGQSGGQFHRDLAELAEFPCTPFTGIETLEEARRAYLCLADLLLTGDSAFRKQVNVRLGFPADRKREKGRLLDLIEQLKAVLGLEPALAAVSCLPPARYTEDDWQIVRACFNLLRHAAAELQVVFAEAGAADFIEVAQIAQRVLSGEDGLPTDAALAVSDGIRHLLVDEFQDTSRRQHRLLAGIVAAWPERAGRTCFAVGDPMQSIYFFRDADAELFPRVKTVGLEVPDPDSSHPDPLLFHFVHLMANFRTEPSLVVRLNQVLGQIFATDDGSGVTFSSAQPARAPSPEPDPRFDLHLKFVPQASRGKIADPGAARARESARAAQTEEIVALIRSHFEPMNQARVRGERYRIAVLGRARSALAPIAQALREAAIPFRAVDLEKLAARPEVLDALALARALLNPHDRVAWLGVLRAPWCGLTLADLHIVAGGDEPELLARPVPGLLAERLPLLSAVGRQTANRVLETMNAAPTLRAANPTASLGTFLESVWLRLEGEECVDATARANLALLFACLDRLPAGEQDLLGPGLDAALDKLTALPDPAAGSDCGVQLMTIHKSKGLEFEVVIVPDLQAGGGRSRGKLLSWLERGLAHPDESGDITEFLIGPLQPKGADRGKAKEWVDSVYRERESQEDRRILYVAATRAREQLHLFARPAYKVESDGSLTLPAPTNSLLATAWPALEEEVRTSFEKWKEAKAASETAEEQVLESIAASAQGNLLVMPSPVKPTKLRRVPPNYKLSGSNERSHQSTESPVQAQKLRDQKEMPGAPGFASETWESEKSKLYARHEGSLLSRALGRAVHSLFENLARLRMTTDWQACRLALQSLEPHIAAQVRTTGVDQAQAAGIAAEALRYALDATRDPLAQWILSPHADAANEVSWVGVIAGSLGTVRVDRVFRAGPTPFAEGENCWWIIDYKTAHAENLAPEAALPELRLLFSPQIEAYAAVLRNLHSSAQIRVGLYYPRMSILDWWEL